MEAGSGPNTNKIGASLMANLAAKTMLEGARKELVGKRHNPKLVKQRSMERHARAKERTQSGGNSKVGEEATRHAQRAGLIHRGSIEALKASADDAIQKL